MRFLVQRVSRASVVVEEETVGKIGAGFFVLIGVEKGDDRVIADKMVQKLIGLRIFEDEEGKSNLSITKVGGEMLLISQFTLAADARQGNRPAYFNAAKSEEAEPMYDYIVDSVRRAGIHVETGVFGAHMKCELLNDGPFTIWLDSLEIWPKLHKVEQ